MHGKRFERGAEDRDSHVISLTEFSSNGNPKLTRDCCVLRFLPRSADGA